MNYPHPGVAGSKPRAPVSGNGSSGKEEFARLSREYLEIRNRGQAAKAFMAETQASRVRGELIDKKWAFDSLAYLMVVFRQRTLLAHRAIARRLVTLGLIDDANEHAVSMTIAEDIRSLLNELAHLPDKATDPGWLKKLEREELGADDKAEHRSSPKESSASKRASSIGVKSKPRRSGKSARRSSLRRTSDLRRLPAAARARRKHLSKTRCPRPGMADRVRRVPVRRNRQSG